MTNLPMPLSLAYYTSAAVTPLNQITCATNNGSIKLAKQSWHWQFEHAQGSIEATCIIDVEWQGGKIEVRLPERALLSWFNHNMSHMPIAKLPQELALAVLEIISTDICEKIATCGGGRPLILAISWTPRDDTDLKQRLFVRWINDSSHEHILIELRLDNIAFTALSTLIQQRPRSPSALNLWDKLPIPLRLCIGNTQIFAQQLATLSHDDVILFDNYYLENELLLVRLHQNIGFRCSLSGHHLTVMESLQMSLKSAETTAESKAVDLDQLPVQLSFDIGEQACTLGELRNLRPGVLFDLGRPLPGVVNIRANNQRIGTGELVNIDNRIGVKILSLQAQGE